MRKQIIKQSPGILNMMDIGILIGIILLIMYRKYVILRIDYQQNCLSIQLYIKSTNILIMFLQPSKTPLGIEIFIFSTLNWLKKKTKRTQLTGIIKSRV